MAKRGIVLKLEAKTCRLGKISNNLERHGDDYTTAFTIPFTELMLTKAELNTLRRDKDTWTSWFDTSNGGGRAVEPMPWWGGEPFYLSDTFEADRMLISVSGDKELEPFESEGDPKEDTYRPAALISKCTLWVQVGGLTELRGSLYLRPGIGRRNLLLQDHQHREIKLTIIGGKVAEDRAKRQPELPLQPEGTAESATH